jgi:hypothetical protein
VVLLHSVALEVVSASADPTNTTKSVAQSQADALSRLIVTGVQQAISSLPPASAQSIVYEFDLAVGVWNRSEKLAPASFLSPQPIGEQRFGFRSALTYLDLSRCTATGDDLIDFVLGLKYEALSDLVLVGNVSVPLTSDGFRPAAAGTVALEYYF